MCSVATQKLDYICTRCAWCNDVTGRQILIEILIDFNEFCK